MFYLYASRFFTLLTFVGLWLAYRQRLPGAGLMAVSLLVYPLMYYVTHTMLRYRHPIDPIMAALTGYALYYPVHAWAAQRNTSPATAAPVFHPKPD